MYSSAVSQAHMTQWHATAFHNGDEPVKEKRAEKILKLAVEEMREDSEERIGFCRRCETLQKM